MQVLPGRYPATVAEYLPESRQARITIPNVTTGGKLQPLAEIEYPVGDRSRGDNSTEIEIVEGDSVWIAFIGGDSRYPIITGFRNPNSGNDIEWRRFHHANIELLADDAINIIATDGDTSVKMGANGIEIKTDKDVTVDVGGNVSVDAGGDATVKAASITMNDGTLGGCVGELTPCQFTGAPHAGASVSVKIGL
jgi:hypothetical protein